MPLLASDKTVGRISLYRRLLSNLLQQKVRSVFSHQLAEAAGVTAAQVRRDMMVVGSNGIPTKGYDVESLIESIGQFLYAPDPEAVALVGVGNLGRAILSYLDGRSPNLKIVAAFDNDPDKADHVISGCRCYATRQMPEIFAENKIATAIITVPADQAQYVCDLLVDAGANGIVNFAPVGLQVPAQIHVENVDMTTSLEKTAYFGRQGCGAVEAGVVLDGATNFAQKACSFPPQCKRERG